MDILGIGFAELLLIFVIAIMIFGPRRLPEIARQAARILGDLRRMSQQLLKEWQRELDEAANLEELRKARDEMKDMSQSISKIGQDIKTEASEAGKEISQGTKQLQNELATESAQLKDELAKEKADIEKAMSDTTEPEEAPTPAQSARPGITDTNRAKTYTPPTEFQPKGTVSRGKPDADNVKPPVNSNATHD